MYFTRRKLWRDSAIDRTQLSGILKGYGTSRPSDQSLLVSSCTVLCLQYLRFYQSHLLPEYVSYVLKYLLSATTIYNNTNFGMPWLALKFTLICPGVPSHSLWSPNMPYLALSCPRNPWVALRCPESPWDALSCPKMPWAALRSPEFPWSVFSWLFTCIFEKTFARARVRVRLGFNAVLFLF